MTVENISWSNLQERMLPTWQRLNLQSPDYVGCTSNWATKADNHICTVWSESSLSTWRNIWSLAMHRVPIKDKSDCMDVQADSSLHCRCMSKSTFSNCSSNKNFVSLFFCIAKNRLNISHEWFPVQFAWNMQLYFLEKKKIRKHYFQSLKSSQNSSRQHSKIFLFYFFRQNKAQHFKRIICWFSIY